jgi:hypothetical protein
MGENRINGLMRYCDVIRPLNLGVMSMKLSTAMAAAALGCAALGSASSAGAATILNAYGYDFGYGDNAIAGVFNDNAFAYSDVKINGVDFGSLAAGATAGWLALGDNEYGSNGPFTVDVMVGGKTFSGVFFDAQNDSDCSVSFGCDSTPISVGELVVSGSVPEPATWALMLGGFGLAGVALRRRPVAIAA